MHQEPSAESSTSTSTRPHPGGEPARPFRYTAAFANEIELRWQREWEARKIFRAPNPGDDDFDPSKPKFYVLDMFPYPSGAGLHVGHPEGYTATDIVARYKRMTGHNVLHPMGFDAFGLPAEQYAIATGVHPAVTTRQAIETFRRQLKSFGFSYDWSREFATVDPDYYRWTQWIWLRAYDAWFDPTVQQARPIENLIQRLENGDIYVNPFGELVFKGVEGHIESLGGEPVGMRKWHELDEQDRRDVIDDQRLAYIAEQTVNWCPKLGTVLANEEVIDGRSERGDFPVFRLPLKQWIFRITAYAERLLADLEPLDWPSSTRAMQREWIGRSEGAEIDFELAHTVGDVSSLRVFTTRPDTIFGATYMVVAPEHPLVDEILGDDAMGANAASHGQDARATIHGQDARATKAGFDRDALRDYVKKARRRSDIERQESKRKTGVYAGVNCINPATGEPIQVWCADYVLSSYGTGAIMAVPGQDERDWEFAEAFNLPIVRTVQPPDDFEGKAYTGEGEAINSTNDDVSLDGLGVEHAKKRIINWLEEKGIGRRRVNYKLRDWLFSRQRYWGEPFPVVFDASGNHYPVSVDALPIMLPEMADYQPIEAETPQPPLQKATKWVYTTAGEAGVSDDLLAPDTPVRRETNTMPGWAGSCWYYLRFCDPRNDERFCSPEAERYWMKGEQERAFAGVDLYIGGSEHAVLHLLYARFWHKILYDLGEVSTPEPVQRLFHQGMIVSHAFEREDGSVVPVDEVEETSEGAFREIATGAAVRQIVAKMSKSLKNVINPDDVIAEYGADTFRLYEMYMGPLEAMKPWNTRDIQGPFRFLQRIWRLAVDENSGELALRDDDDVAVEEVERALHRTIHKVGFDIDRLAFNTAIAAMMEFVNVATQHGGVVRDQLDRFVRVLAPFAPHIAEELWRRLGRDTSITRADWPQHDASMLVEDEIEIPVQIMGKVRCRITVPADADADEVERIALADPRVQEQLEGRTVQKVVVVPGRIVNIVAGG